jgi:hypothetical protein
MANPFGHKSEKHEKIDRENARIVGTVGGAVFLVIFSLFAAQALISQSLYQNRVISEKKTALKQLKENKTAADDLRNVYSAFVSEPENVLGGSPDGDTSVDGDNAKIVLDALPGEYDYPGLASSVEKILLDGGYSIEAVGGSEDSSLGGSVDSSAPVEIPYPFSVNANPASTKELLETLEKSIRPFYVDTLTIRSSQLGLRTSLGVRTFYQPEVQYELGTKVVR